MNSKPLRIGTRGSPLALKQTELVCEGLKQAHPDLSIDVQTIRTSGDWVPQDGEKRLSEMEGGKGLFAKELEKALLDGAIDCAVHSLKDMPSFLPEGLVIEHVLPREDARDALICRDAKRIEDLPPGVRVGTSSLRRQAILLSQREDLRIVPLRGNVHTRLQKLDDLHAEATILAMAGLNRLGIEDACVTPLSPEEMLPACGQGIVGIETREGDAAIQDLLSPLHCAKTGYCAFAERAVLKVLDGSCHTPIAAYAVFDGDEMHLRALVASEHGGRVFFEEARAEITSNQRAVSFGDSIGHKLKIIVPPELLS